MGADMKKILIFRNEITLAPVGGSTGYLYNLKCGMGELSQNNLEIDFLLTKNSILRNSRFYKFLKKIKWLRKFKQICSRKKDYTYLLNDKKSHISDVDLSHYDVIHFHSTIDMYRVRDSLKEYRGIVCLTSHSPTLLSKEIYDEELTCFEKRRYKKLYNHLIKMDEYAFNRADSFIFPCEQAEEPYAINYDKWDIIKRTKKFYYVPTGIVEANPKINKAEIRNKYNIPQSAFVISYVGRHNEIKGYDRLKEIGCVLLREYDDIYFLIAGREEPLKGLNQDRWIEAGWTNDPHSIINAADIFVLPNKETYFDLIMLEVLSLGKIVVASRTGGNKYFINKSDGIMLFEDNVDAVKLILNIKKLSAQEIKQMEDSNLQLYSQEFTCESFAKNYFHIYASILDDFADK